MTSVAVISKPPFSLKTLRKDSNCVLIQDPSAIWGGSDHLPRRNLLLATDTLATQNVTVTAEAHTLYLQGTGSVTLSGTGSGTLQGTGANDRVTLAFTPTAGTLTLTVSGTVTFGMLCKSSVVDRSYQRVTDWTTEQYAWAAQKNVPWLRRNIFTYTEDFGNAYWGTASNVTVSTNTAETTDPSGGNNADKMIEAATTATHRVAANGAITCFSPPIGTTVTLKSRLKYGSRQYVALWFSDQSGSNTYRQVFDIQNGTVGSGGAVGTLFPLVSSSIVSLGGGWYECSLTATYNSPGTGVFAYPCAHHSSDNYTALSFLGDVGKYTYLGGAQLSVGACDYQRIATTWPAEYTSLALAAGYPISLYSDRAGTTATYGPDDPVGVLLDQSEGLALGPNLITNGDGTSTTGWDASSYGSTVASVSGELQVTATAGYGRRVTAVTLTAGKSYVMTGTARLVSGITGARWGVGGSNGDFVSTYYSTNTTTSNVTSSFLFVASAQTTHVVVGVSGNAASDVTAFDNISVREIPGYHATAPSDAARPNLRLDGNGKFYLDRDTTDDNLPITWPTNLTATGVIYTATGDYTTKDSGLILSGATDYKFPQRPSGDYGRIVMAAESKYDAKIIKYLDQKRGRSYQLGPELVVNGGFDSTAWWSKHANVTISDGVATLASVPTGNGVGKSGILTSGKTYLVAFDIVTVTAGAMYVYAGAVPAWSRGYSGKMSVTVQASGADFYLFTSGTTSCVLDNVSVREILL